MEEEEDATQGKVLNDIDEVNKGNVKWPLKDKSIEEVEEGANSYCWENQIAQQFKSWLWSKADWAGYATHRLCDSEQVKWMNFPICILEKLFFFSLCIISYMIRLPFSVNVGLGGRGVKRTGVFC